MITALHVIATFIGVGELILAFFFWLTNSGNRIRWVMGLIAFSMGIWVILNVLTSYTNRTAFTDAIIPLLFLAIVVLLVAIVHFSLEFPYPMFRIDRLHILLLYLPATIFAYLLFFTHGIIRDYQLDRTSTGYVLPGDTYPVFAGLMLVGLLLRSECLVIR